MARKGPLVTLLGGGVLAGGLLVANVINTPGEPDDDQAAASEQTADAEPTETAEPDTEPTETEEPEPADADETADAEAAGDADPVTYVGWVDGGGTSVAIVIDGDEAIAYVCDGVTEAWLTGTAYNGELSLTGDDGELTASYDENRAAGETVVGDQAWTFEIEYVAPPEGLYQVADTIVGGAEVDGGWIVLPDGRQIGVLNVGADTRPAPELDPETGQVIVSDTTITADRLGGEE